jgi:exopolyphosphatase/guanosine-5'-triphosphate,3'-diphosphate pyrophosphatase
MIFDIGGGSTELVLIESTGAAPRILDWQSVPWGVVSLTEPAAMNSRTPKGAPRSLCPHARNGGESLGSFAERRRAHARATAAVQPLRLLGTSGTVTTLASLHLDLPQYDRRAVDGLIVPAPRCAPSAAAVGMSLRSGAPCPASVRSGRIWWWRAAPFSKRSSTCGPPTGSAWPIAAFAKASCAA